MQIRKAFAIAALIAAPTALPAQIIFSGSGCAGGAFTFCASRTGSNLAANQFRFEITNTSNLAPANNGNSAFTQVAIGGHSLGDPLTMAAVTGWQYDNDVNGFNGFGLNTNDFAAITTNGINNALLDGQSRTFDFTFGTDVFSGLTGAQAFAAYFTGVQVAIHDQGTFGNGSCGNSSKGVMNGVTGAPTTASTNSCDQDITTTSTVPEPSTYVLMAAGLAGLGVISRRRRA